MIRLIHLPDTERWMICDFRSITGRSNCLPCLLCGHHRFIAISGVTTHKKRAHCSWKVIQNFQKPRKAVGAVGFIPRGDINTQNQAQVGDQVAMVAMRGPPGLGWIVTDLRALLFAIDWFDHGIHVQYPAVLRYRMQRNCQMLLQPDYRFFLINGFQSSPHRVVTADLAHSQQGRIDTIMSQRVDMGIAPTASHNGQQQRDKYILDLWCVRAGELQRTGLGEWIEQIGCFRTSMKNGN